VSSAEGRRASGPAPRLFVFDLDGTLVDSRRDLADAVNAMLATYGRAPLPLEAVTGMIGEGAALLVERASRAAGLPGTPGDGLARFLACYDERLVAHTALYPGVDATLGALAARAAVAVLTNKPQRHAERLLAHFGLAARLAGVIGGDGAFPKKPAPDGVLHLAGLAGTTADRTLVVGDSWVDVETARRAGAGVAVARYGFGYPQMPEGTLSGHEITIDDIAELVGIWSS
jgi:phosphoglycolate phosphatase